MADPCYTADGNRPIQSPMPNAETEDAQLADPEFRRAYLAARAYSFNFHDNPDRVIPAAAWSEAEANQWHSITFHLHLAEAMHGHAIDRRDQEAIDGFMSAAEESGDQALISRALISKANFDDPSLLGDEADDLIARAIALLRGGRGSPLHRASAYIASSRFFSQRNLWDLSLEVNKLAVEELERPVPSTLEHLVRHSLLATTANQCLAHVNLASEAFETDFREEAVNAYRDCPSLTAELERDGVLRFRSEVMILRNLLAALAGAEPDHRTQTPEELTVAKAGDWADSAQKLTQAVRLLDAGDTDGASLVAEQAAPGLEDYYALPYFLALSIAALQPPISPVAHRYNRWLALDRRETRLRGAHEARMRSVAAEVELASHDLRVQLATDPLTGIGNRRALEQLKEDMEGTDESTLVGAIVIDVNKFKDVNDQFGHALGDEVLVRIAEVLSDSVRAEDVAARTGGDEFIVVLVNVAADVVEARARHIDLTIRSIDWGSLADGLAASASVGWAFGASHHFDQLIIDADHRMYDSKGFSGLVGPGSDRR